MNKFPLNRQSYELLHLIGEKQGMKTYMARCMTNNKPVCIKMVDIDEVYFDLEKWHECSSCWMQLTNCNINEYYGSFMIGSVLWILTEYTDGGSLEHVLRYGASNGIKDETLIASILLQVLNFLIEYHKNNKVHKDIRPATILITSHGIVKLADAGLFACLRNEGCCKYQIKARVDSPIYIAPEVLVTKNYTPKADVWSLGITAIELFTGIAPLSNTSEKIVNNILKTKDHHLSLAGASKQFTDFVNMCLSPSNIRPTVHELIKSPFIKKAQTPKYISSILMCNLPSQAQIYKAFHPCPCNTVNLISHVRNLSDPGFVFPGETPCLQGPKVPPPPQLPKVVKIQHKKHFTVRVYTPQPEIATKI